MQKNHFEILLEDINSKLDLVLEGHAALDKKIDIKFAELKEKIDINSFKIDTLSKRVNEVDKRLSRKIDEVDKRLSRKIDDIAADLKAHREDTEAHHGVYRVKKG